MGRGKKYEYKAHQRRPNSSTRFVQVYHDLLDSPAFQDLTAQQKTLYVYCILESHGKAMVENQKTRLDERLFYMNKQLYVHVHKLYSEKDTRGFNRDMAALITHGLIDCVESNYKRRKKNLYRLSQRWHNWGTDAFEMPEEVMTNHMRIARAKRNATIDEPSKEKTPAPSQYPHTDSTQDEASSHVATNQDEQT